MATSAQPVEIPPKSIRAASAVCEPGATAVSSGFESPDFSLKTDSAVVRIGVKQGRRRVKVRAHNFGEDRGRLIAYVYCRGGIEAPVKRSARTIVAPGRAKSIVAVCPRGMTAISGGFSTGAFNQRAGPRVLTLSSKRLGTRRWQVQAIYLPEDDATYSGPLRPGKLVAYANCAREVALAKVAKRVNVPAQTRDGEGSQTRSFRVRCPRGSRAVSGGFDGNLTLRGNEGNAAGAVTSMRSRDGRGWRTAAISVSERTASKMTAFVYCLTRAG